MTYKPFPAVLESPARVVYDHLLKADERKPENETTIAEGTGLPWGVVDEALHYLFAHEVAGYCIDKGYFIWPLPNPLPPPPSGYDAFKRQGKGQRE